MLLAIDNISLCAILPVEPEQEEPMATQMTAEQALEKAISYEADAQTYQNQGDFASAKHSLSLSNDYFERALELANAG